jgi:hypothetical protein
VDNSAKGDNDDALRVTPVSPEPKPLTKNPFASVGGVSNHAREAEKPTPEDLPNHDEYGRTTADCDRHVGNPTDDPCKACGTARVEFQASAARRDEARDRIKAAGRRAEWQVPVNEVADVPAAIAAAKAALRGRKRRAESEAQARRASAIGGAA